MAFGILDLVGMAVTIALAASIGLFGVELLVQGETVWGGAMVAIAVGLVLLERFVVTPGDLVGRLVQDSTAAALEGDGEE